MIFRRTVWGLAIAVTLYAFLLVTKVGLRAWRSSRTAWTEPAVVAQILNRQRSVLHGDPLSLKWNEIELPEDVRAHDSVRTGAAASARVELNDGTRVDLGENSLVNFAGESVDLKYGAATVLLTGTERFTLGADPLTLNGQQALLRLSNTPQGGAQVLLIAGQATGESVTGHVELAQERFLTLRRGEPPQEVAVVTETEAQASDYTDYVYYLRLDDVYETKPGGELIPRGKPLRELSRTVLLTWKNQPAGKILYVQHSSSPEFTPAQTFETKGPVLALAKVFTGDNYWRVSADRESWEESRFSVTALNRPETPPLLRVPEHNLTGVPATQMLNIESDTPFSTFLVESSRAPDFPPAGTRAHWLDGVTFMFNFDQPGAYYFRVRGLNARRELSAFSPVQTVRAGSPLPPPPRLKAELHGRVNRPLKVSWSPARDIERYMLRIFDENGNKIKQTLLIEPRLTFRSARAGVFTYSLQSVDATGRISDKTTHGLIDIR